MRRLILVAVLAVGLILPAVVSGADPSLITTGDTVYTPTVIRTTSTVHLGDGPTIYLIELNTEAEVPGVSEAEFQEKALAAKQNCPVSKVLTGAEIRLNAKLV